LDRVYKVILFVAAVIAVLTAPTMCIVLYRAHPETWPAELKEYQALGGALVALSAAGLTTIGILLSIKSQRDNLQKQLADQHTQQDRARLRERQRVASAFAGEISNMISILGDDSVRQHLNGTLEGLKAHPGPVQGVRIFVKARYYEANPGNVGLFPHPLPQQLVEFYNRLEGLILYYERYNAAAIASTTDLSEARLVELHFRINSVLQSLDPCITVGKTVLTQLQGICEES
jgi:hypothetical protein